MRDFLKELEEWSEALLEAGVRWAAENREEVRTCYEVKRDYQRALECINRYTDNLPQSDEEWDELHDCLQDLERYASDAEAMNCRW